MPARNAARAPAPQHPIPRVRATAIVPTLPPTIAATIAKTIALVLATGLTPAMAPREAQAQTPTTLPPVEVIGVSPVPGVELPRDRIPAAVQTARAADLERSQALDLSAFLARRLGSVHLNEVQGNPLQPDLNFRGYTASPLLGSAQGLSVYVDGVRINQPFGDVVSWDLIPRSAIASIVLNPGSNPLFGLNTLGGAIVVQTKDGLTAPGTSVQFSGGSNGRAVLGFEHGASDGQGRHVYLHGQAFHEDGWRQASPSTQRQFFARIGQRRGDTDLRASLALADTALTGNGLQDVQALGNDWASVYTRPDTTRNRSVLATLAWRQQLGDGVALQTQAHARRLRTRTFNGDLNDGSLDQSTVQPNAAEQAALAAAGFSGFPTSGATAANTPFPKWRCIANALLQDEPAEKCNGLLNRTATAQDETGLQAQLEFEGRVAGFTHQSFVGAGWLRSRSQFTQSTELGYLESDRSVTGVGAFGDGVTGGDVDGAPYDTRVDLSGRSRTASLYASTVLGLGGATHLTVSGRYDRTTIRNRDALLPGGGPGSLDTDATYARFNPAVGLNFAPAAGLAAWVGVGQGSRNPSSIELGCADPANPCKLPNAFAGDPPLRAVVATTLEAGLRGRARGGTVDWSLGLFRSDNRDDLLFVADDAAGFGYFRNFGRTRRQGVELGLDWQAERRLQLGARYTWLDATFRTAETVGGSANSSNDAASAGLPGTEGTIRIQPGDRIPLVPRQMLKLSVDWQATPSWRFGADLQAVGRSTARGNENGGHRPDGVYFLGAGDSAGYAVLNLDARWQASPRLALFGQVGNLFDTRYTTAAQLGATGFTADGRYRSRPFPANANGDFPLRSSTFYAPGAPRSVSLGVKASF